VVTGLLIWDQKENGGQLLSSETPEEILKQKNQLLEYQKRYYKKQKNRYYFSAFFKNYIQNILVVLFFISYRG
jgi:hypothetical protein